MFLLITTSTSTLEPTKPQIKRVSEALSTVKGGRGVELTIHLILVSRL
jgi:hypothetical protein